MKDEEKSLIEEAPKVSSGGATCDVECDGDDGREMLISKAVPNETASPAGGAEEEESSSQAAWGSSSRKNAEDIIVFTGSYIVREQVANGERVEVSSD